MIILSCSVKISWSKGRTGSFKSVPGSISPHQYSLIVFLLGIQRNMVAAPLQLGRATGVVLGNEIQAMLVGVILFFIFFYL